MCVHIHSLRDLQSQQLYEHARRIASMTKAIPRGSVLLEEFIERQFGAGDGPLL